MFRLFLLLFIVNNAAYADGRFSVGVKLISSEWLRNVTVSAGDVQQKGGQTNLSLKYQRDKFFTAISVQGGEFDFKKMTPDKITISEPVSVSSDTVSHGEFDLLVGYYFFERSAFFMDIKTTADKWLGDDYQQNFSGLGLGVSSFYPINEKWLIYGSLGGIGKGELKDVNGRKLADASSSALEIAASYRLNIFSSLSFGLKSRGYQYLLNNGNKQAYSISSIFLSYHYLFVH